MEYSFARTMKRFGEPYVLVGICNDDKTLEKALNRLKDSGLICRFHVVGSYSNKPDGERRFAIYMPERSYKLQRSGIVNVLMGYGETYE